MLLFIREQEKRYTSSGLQTNMTNKYLAKPAFRVKDNWSLVKVSVFTETVNDLSLMLRVKFTLHLRGTLEIICVLHPIVRCNIKPVLSVRIFMEMYLGEQKIVLRRQSCSYDQGHNLTSFELVSFLSDNSDVHT